MATYDPGRPSTLASGHAMTVVEAPTPVLARSEATSTDRRRNSPRALEELSGLGVTLGLTMASVGFALRLWDASLRIPFAYHFDALFHASLLKATLEEGWYTTNPALGAPAGLELHDFPFGGENLHFAIVKLLGLFSHDWAVVLNLYFLLGFLLTSAMAYVVLRQLGLRRWPASMLANLFCLLPYHFVAGELQLFQGAYFAVPLAGLLVLDALGWPVWSGPFVGRSAPASTRARWAVRVGLCAVVASAGSYYAVFSLVFVAAAAGLALLSGGGGPALGRAVAVIVLLLAMLVANNAPSLLYRRAHGPNPELAVRAAGESDYWALRVVDLFLPAKDHRLPAFAALKEQLEGWPVQPVSQAAHVPLGLAGAGGLTISLVAIAQAAMAGGRRRAGAVRAGLGQLGALNLVAILFGVATGFSALLTLAGVGQVRAWSRLSVFIAFFALTALGLCVQALWSRPPAVSAPGGVPRPAVRRLAMALVPVVFALLVLDQTQPSLVPAYAVNRGTFERDQAFVRSIERLMPGDAAVFQLPLAAFPEQSAVAFMADYSLMRGYLHSDRLRWSYAAARGRPADWTWSLGGRPVGAVVDSVTAAGFSGLYVDESGFPDYAAAVRSELDDLVGPPAVESANGLLFWDLRPVADAQRARLGPAGVDQLRRRVLQPVRPRWGKGFGAAGAVPALAMPRQFRLYPEVAGQSSMSQRLAGSPAWLELDNPMSRPRPVQVRLGLRTAGVQPRSVTVAAPGIPPTTVTVGVDQVPVTLDLVLPPGVTRLGLTHTAVDHDPTPSLGIWVQNLLVVDSE